MRVFFLRFVYAVLAVSLVLLTGCDGHLHQGAQREQEECVADSLSDEDLSYVSRLVPYAGDFNQITNVSDADIVYSDGDCDIVIEGPKHLVDAIRVSFDSGIVTFSQLEESKSNMFSRQSDIGGVIIRVSCPDLRMLAVCGGGSFVSEGVVRSSSLHVGTLSMGRIEMDSLLVEDSFIYETSDNGGARFGYLHTGGDVSIYKSDDGRLDASVCCGGRFSLTASAKGVSNLSVEAPFVELQVFDDSRCEVSLMTDNLSLSAFDHSVVDVTSRGEIKNRNVQRGKNAKVVFNALTEG